MKFLTLLVLSLFIFTACKESQAAIDDKSSSSAQKSSGDCEDCNGCKDHEEDDHQEHEHHHEAPYGGVLHGLEGHQASISCLVEKDAMTIYIHDGCAEKDVRIAHEKLDVKVSTATGDQSLTLLPVESSVSGDKVGAASSFKIEKGGITFEDINKVFISSITIKGIEYKDVYIQIKE